MYITTTGQMHSCTQKRPHYFCDHKQPLLTQQPLFWSLASFSHTFSVTKAGFYLLNYTHSLNPSRQANLFMIGINCTIYVSFIAQEITLSLVTVCHLSALLVLYYLYGTDMSRRLSNQSKIIQIPKAQHLIVSLVPLGIKCYFSGHSQFCSYSKSRSFLTTLSL